MADNIEWIPQSNACLSVRRVETPLRQSMQTSNKNTVEGDGSRTGTAYATCMRV